jgi:hypothetical protein
MEMKNILITVPALLLPIAALAANVDSELIEATRTGDTEHIRSLLVAGADPNARDEGPRNMTALMIAAGQGHTATARILIDAGAQVDAKDKVGATALMWAAYFGNTETAKLLLSCGAKVNETHNGGGTALIDAAEKGPDRVPVTSRMERVQLDGFSVLPPWGSHWFIRTKGSQSVVFEKDTPAGPDHTVIASAESYQGAFGSAKEVRNVLKGASEGLPTAEPLEQLRETLLRESQSDGRHKSLEMQVSLDSSREQPCVTADFRCEDHGVPYKPGSVFLLTGSDLYCLDPSSSSFVAKVSFSQRHLKGEGPLPIRAELRPFLSSLAFASLPSMSRTSESSRPVDELMEGRTYTNLPGNFTITLPDGWDLNEGLRSRSPLSIAAFSSPGGKERLIISPEIFSGSLEDYKVMTEKRAKKTIEEYEKLSESEVVIDDRQAVLQIYSGKASKTLRMKLLTAIVPFDGGMTLMTAATLESHFDAVQDVFKDIILSYKTAVGATR